MESRFPCPVLTLNMESNPSVFLYKKLICWNIFASYLLVLYFLGQNKCNSFNFPSKVRFSKCLSLLQHDAKNSTQLSGCPTCCEQGGIVSPGVQFWFSLKSGSSMTWWEKGRGCKDGQRDNMASVPCYPCWAETLQQVKDQRQAGWWRWVLLNW